MFKLQAASRLAAAHKIEAAQVKPHHFQELAKLLKTPITPGVGALYRDLIWIPKSRGAWARKQLLSNGWEKATKPPGWLHDKDTQFFKKQLEGESGPAYLALNPLSPHRVDMMNEYSKKYGDGQTHEVGDFSIGIPLTLAEHE